MLAEIPSIGGRECPNLKIQTLQRGFCEPPMQRNFSAFLAERSRSIGLMEPAPNTSSWAVAWCIASATCGNGHRLENERRHQIRETELCARRNVERKPNRLQKVRQRERW